MALLLGNALSLVYHVFFSHLDFKTKYSSSFSSMKSWKLRELSICIAGRWINCSTATGCIIIMSAHLSKTPFSFYPMLDVFSHTQQPLFPHSLFLVLLVSEFELINVVMNILHQCWLIYIGFQ